MIFFIHSDEADKPRFLKSNDDRFGSLRR